LKVEEEQIILINFLIKNHVFKGNKISEKIILLHIK